MKQRLFKIMVTLLASLTLGSRAIGSGVSIANASENTSIQVTQYLLNHGVKLNELFYRYVGD